MRILRVAGTAVSVLTASLIPLTTVGTLESAATVIVDTASVKAAIGWDYEQVDRLCRAGTINDFKALRDQLWAGPAKASLERAIARGDLGALRTGACKIRDALRDSKTPPQSPWG
jgi:hypothetical protein